MHNHSHSHPHHHTPGHGAGEHSKISRLDMIGFSASTICAIHCALLPFAIVLLPLLGLEFIANPVIEYSLIGLSLVIGLYTLKNGYFYHHGRLYPVLIFLTGLAVVVIGHLFFHEHTLAGESEHGLSSELIFFMIAPIGAILIGIGHYTNRKLCNTCKADITKKVPGKKEKVSPRSVVGSHLESHPG